MLLLMVMTMRMIIIDGPLTECTIQQHSTGTGCLFRECEIPSDRLRTSSSRFSLDNQLSTKVLFYPLTDTGYH